MYSDLVQAVITSTIVTIVSSAFIVATLTFYYAI
jgi:hypothetical protein